MFDEQRDEFCSKSRKTVSVGNHNCELFSDEHPSFSAVLVDDGICALYCLLEFMQNSALLLLAVQAALQSEIAGVKSDLGWLKWLLGTGVSLGIAIGVGVLLLLLRMAGGL